MLLAHDLKRAKDGVSLRGGRHRCLTSARTTDRRAAVSRADSAWELSRLVDFGAEPLFPLLNMPFVNFGDKPADVAAKVRMAWHKKDDPIIELLGLIEDSGVVVASLPKISREVSAFSCWFGETPIMLVDGSSHFRKNRFCVAHELGHLLMHRDVELDSRKAEREAHRFAGALLLPEVALHGLTDPLDWVKVRSTAETYGVRSLTVLRQCSETGALGSVAYAAAVARVSALSWRARYPDDVPDPEQPAGLEKAAMKALESNQGESTGNRDGLAMIKGLLDSVITAPPPDIAGVNR